MGLRVALVIGAAAVLLLTIGLDADVTLLDAVKRGDAAAVRALRAREDRRQRARADGTTALHWAAQRDDRRRSSAAPGRRRRRGRRQSLRRHAACAGRTNGNAAIVERLLVAGADANTALPGGETVLMTAARTGSTEAVQGAASPAARTCAPASGARARPR